MAENSKISWTDDTFNPWIGCTKIGPACDHCYAEAMMDTRYHKVKWGNHPRQRTSEDYWKQPLKWEREQVALLTGATFKKVQARAAQGDPEALAGLVDAANLYREGRSRFVFCASLADVFDNQVDPAWLRDLFDLIRATPHLTWLLLTKRPQNIIKLFYAAHPEEYDASLVWPPNAAIGCTVVTQAELERDVRILLTAKATMNPAFAFVSMEPLRELVSFSECWDLLTGLDWVITGGETDQAPFKARPAHPRWFKILRDQCAQAGVAFHFKQRGSWTWMDDADAEAENYVDIPLDWRTKDRGVVCMRSDGTEVSGYGGGDEEFLVRCNVKRSGRLLDGVTHDARPGLVR